MSMAVRVAAVESKPATVIVAGAPLLVEKEIQFVLPLQLPNPPRLTSEEQALAKNKIPLLLLLFLP